MPSQKVYDLLIVGAGPVGLATAVGAHQRGCRNILILDQTRGFGHAGEIVDLQPNGICALKHVAPAVANVLIESQSGGKRAPPKWCDVDGNRLQRQTAGDRKYPVVSVKWSQLQRHLLDALPEDVEVCTNSQLVGMEFLGDDCDVVCAEFIRNRRRENAFVNWEGDPAEGAGAGAPAGADANAVDENEEPTSVSVHAKIVVGADGINSLCRELVYQYIGGEEWVPMARAQYSGFISFKGKATLGSKYRTELEEAKSTFLFDSPFCLVNARSDEDIKLSAPRSMFCCLPESIAARLGWEWLFLIHAAFDERLARREKDVGGHAALHKRALEMLQEADFPDSLLRVADILLGEVSDGEERTVIARPLFVVPIDEPAPFERVETVGELPPVPNGFYRPFGYKQIFLAGDALHGMPPFMAQGTSMGFEDVVELVDLLAKSQRWGTASNSSATDEAEAGDSFENVLAQYREARIERLSKVQWETLSRGAADEAVVGPEVRKYVLDYVPIADGYAHKE